MPTTIKEQGTTRPNRIYTAKLASGNIKHFTFNNTQQQRNQ